MAYDFVMTQIDHDAAAHRFSTIVDGERAVLDYTLAADVMTITHTEVPRPIEGRGIAAQLTRKAIEIAREHRWRVVPACSYAANYLARHPLDDDGRKQHQSDLLDEALDESFPASDPPAVGDYRD
jgi:predicted GNAT family acetyltransferase